MTASRDHLQRACRRLSRARQAIYVCQDCGVQSEDWWPATEKARLAVERAMVDLRKVLDLRPKGRRRKGRSRVEVER